MSATMPIPVGHLARLLGLPAGVAVTGAYVEDDHLVLDLAAEPGTESTTDLPDDGEVTGSFSVDQFGAGRMTSLRASEPGDEATAPEAVTGSTAPDALGAGPSAESLAAATHGTPAANLAGSKPAKPRK